LFSSGVPCAAPEQSTGLAAYASPEKTCLVTKENGGFFLVQSCFDSLIIIQSHKICQKIMNNPDYLKKYFHKANKLVIGVEG